MEYIEKRQQLKEKLFERFNENEINDDCENLSLYTVLKSSELLDKYNKIFSKTINKDLIKMNKILTKESKIINRKSQPNKNIIDNVILEINNDELTVTVSSYINGARFYITNKKKINEQINKRFLIDDKANGVMLNGEFEDRLICRNLCASTTNVIAKLLPKYYSILEVLTEEIPNLNYKWDRNNENNLSLGDDFIKANINLNDTSKNYVTFTNLDNIITADVNTKDGNLYDYVVFYKDELAKKTKVKFDDLNPTLKVLTQKYINDTKVKKLTK